MRALKKEEKKYPGTGAFTAQKVAISLVEKIGDRSLDCLDRSRPRRCYVVTPALAESVIMASVFGRPPRKCVGP